VKWGPKAQRMFFGEHHWTEPFAWNRKAEKSGERRRVFCASMADVCEDRPELEAYRTALWHVIENTPWLDWLLLTKRPERFLEVFPDMWHEGVFPRNVWLGTSAEDQRWFNHRAPLLAEAKETLGAQVSFLSLEPLLGPVQVLDCLMEGAYGFYAPVDWIIVGAESGVDRRPFEIPWLQSVAEQCKDRAALFVKQDSGRFPGAQGRIPDELWIHEFPR